MSFGYTPQVASSIQIMRMNGEGRVLNQVIRGVLGMVLVAGFGLAQAQPKVKDQAEFDLYFWTSGLRSIRTPNSSRQEISSTRKPTPV